MAGMSEVFNLDFKFGGNSEFLSRLEQLMQRVDARFDSVTEGVENATNATKDMSEAVDDLNDSFKEGMGTLSSFGEKLKDIAQYYISFQTIRAGAEKVWSFGRESMDAYSTQERAENQLKGVMKNRGNLDQFQAIKDYAANIQGRSIYGDEAMIKGAGELATYVQGTESLKSMMDLLTDYAAGMTGGGEVSPEQMESLATGLGMAYDGNYMAMRRRGFDTSKLEALDALQESGGVWTEKMQKKFGSTWEKEDIENFKAIVKEAKALGGVSEQMRVDALNESLKDWKGLSDAVNGLDSSALIRLNNKLGDLRENLGKKIYPAFNSLVDTIDKHMPDIEDAFNAVGEVFMTIAKTIEDNFDKIKDFVGLLAKALKVITEYPKTSLSVAVGLKAISSGALTASMSLSKMSGEASKSLKELDKLGVAATALAGAGIGAASMDTEGMEGKNIGSFGGLLGGVAMAALGGAKAFGVFGAAAAAAAASVGAALKAIWDEIEAHENIKKTEGDWSEKETMFDNMLMLQRKVISARKRGYSSEIDATTKNLQTYVDAFEKKYGKGSAGVGIYATLAGGMDKYNAKNASEQAKKAQKDSKGNLYQQFNNTNVTQNVSLAADIQKVGILLNQNIRAIIEKQMRQNREVALTAK